MKWIIGITSGAMLVAVGLVASEWIRRRSASRIRLAAMTAWRGAIPARVEIAMRERIAATPDNPTAWYLLGCGHLRSGRVKDAARAFGMAYHQDVELESAALLTFACLKAAEGETSDILDQIAITWGEMKSPRFVDSAADCRVIEALGAGDAPGGLTMLGRLAWAVTGERQRGALGRTGCEFPDVWRPFFE